MLRATNALVLALAVVAAATLLWAIGSLPDPDRAAAQAAEPPALAEGEVRRLSGSDRWTTPAEVTEVLWPEGADTVLLATGFDYPDALAGAPLAASEDAPLLLTPTGGLTDAVRDALVRLDPDEVVVLGGTSAVSGDVVDSVEALAGAPRVERVAGADRFATAEQAYIRRQAAPLGATRRWPPAWTFRMRWRLGR